MDLTIHNITKITAAITEVRGNSQCPDHDLVRLVITNDVGQAFELSLFTGVEYGGKQLASDISIATTKRA